MAEFLAVDTCRILEHEDIFLFAMKQYFVNGLVTWYATGNRMSNMTKTILVFGNPDLEMDSLPLRILPELEKRYPNIDFCVLDPNEELDVEGDVVVIDTVVGFGRVAVFEGLDTFQNAPRVTMHDFDALANLRFLQKLGKLGKVTVIGVPPGMNGREAVKEIAGVIDNLHRQ